MNVTTDTQLLLLYMPLIVSYKLWLGHKYRLEYDESAGDVYCYVLQEETCSNA